MGKKKILIFIIFTLIFLISAPSHAQSMDEKDRMIQEQINPKKNNKNNKTGKKNSVHNSSKKNKESPYGIFKLLIPGTFK